jgi:hypothetical protein
MNFEAQAEMSMEEEGREGRDFEDAFGGEAPDDLEPKDSEDLFDDGPMEPEDSYDNEAEFDRFRLMNRQNVKELKSLPKVKKLCDKVKKRADSAVVQAEATRMFGLCHKSEFGDKMNLSVSNKYSSVLVTFSHLVNYKNTKEERIKDGYALPTDYSEVTALKFIHLNLFPLPKYPKRFSESKI